LEKKYGLVAVSCRSDRITQTVQKENGLETTVSNRHAQTEKQKSHSSNQPPITQLLADIIDAATRDQPTVTQLIQRLRQKCVVVYPQFNTVGLFKEAIAFELNDVKVSGYKLGSTYSFPGTQRKRGVSYKPERDLPVIHSYRGTKQVEMPETTIETMIAGLSPEDEITLVNTNINDTNQTMVKHPAGITRSAIASGKSSKNALDSEARSAISVDGDGQTSSLVSDIIPSLITK
jgi:hypothetical protein